MPSIGQVTLQPDGSYKGRLSTLSIRQNIELVLNRKRARTNQTSGSCPARLRSALPGTARRFPPARTLFPCHWQRQNLVTGRFTPILAECPDQRKHKEFAIIWNPSG